MTVTEIWWHYVFRKKSNPWDYFCFTPYKNVYEKLAFSTGYFLSQDEIPPTGVGGCDFRGLFFALQPLRNSPDSPFIEEGWLTMDDGNFHIQSLFCLHQSPFIKHPSYCWIKLNLKHTQTSHDKGNGIERDLISIHKLAFPTTAFFQKPKTFHFLLGCQMLYLYLVMHVMLWVCVFFNICYHILSVYTNACSWKLHNYLYMHYICV